MKLALILLTTLLAGCSGAQLVDNQEGQSGQGKDRWQLELCTPPECQTPIPKSMTVDVGRDKTNVSVEVRSPDGWLFKYHADVAQGVNAAALRAEVERRLGEIQGDIAPTAIKALFDAALRAVAPVP